MRAASPLALLLAGAIAAGCAPREERADAARAAVRQALERGDRARALDAIGDLRDALPETPDALLEVAGLLVQAGDAPRTGWLLEEGVRRHPERDDLKTALARVAMLLGNPSQAREAVLAIGADSEQHAAALVVRAQAELQLGDLERALATLAEADRLYPDRPEARLVRISTLLAERRRDDARAAVEEARAALDRAAAQTPEQEEEARDLQHRLDVTLAQIQAEQGETDAALASLRERVRSDAQDVLAWRTLVNVLAQQQRRAEAIALLEEALAGDGPPAELRALLAELHVAAGDEAAAEAALRALVETSDSPAAIVPLAEFLSERDRTEDLLAALDAALARFPDEPRLRLLRFETLLARKLLDGARAEADRFTETTFEGDPEVDYVRARLALAGGDARRAAEQLRHLAPRLDTAATQFWLGRALEETGDTEGARRRYGLAQQRDPAWPAPAAALLALEQARGDWAAVAGTARLLVARAPETIGAWVALVAALESLGEGEAAEQVARQCRERHPDRPEPHVLVAQALRAQGRTDEALTALAEAERAGAGPEAAVERVLTLGMGGRVAEGVAAARTALAADPERADLHAALASLLFAAGAGDEGDAATDRALALEPSEPRPLRVRCEFRAASGAFGGARDDCARYLEARPDDALAHFLLGLAFAGLGEDERAVAAYRRAAELDERDPRPRNNLADLLARRGDLDGALDAAQEAYRLAEKDPYVMDTLGALYLEKKLGSRAVALLEQAHAGLPEHPEVALHLARAYREVGRSEDARGILTALDERGLDDPALRARLEEELRVLR
jgi:tetratricopeptide (TPR) repeat protein